MSMQQGRPLLHCWMAWLAPAACLVARLLDTMYRSMVGLAACLTQPGLAVMLGAHRFPLQHMFSPTTPVLLTLWLHCR